MVIVQVQTNTISYGKIHVGDSILKVNGIKVEDPVYFTVLLNSAKDATLQIEFLRNDKKTQEMASTKATIVIARPDCDRSWVKKALEKPILDAPSIRLADDIRDIAARERYNIKANAKPFMKKGPQNDKVAVITDIIKEHQIVSDNDEKGLRKVKK
uniref:PDZ domain-containing protein n=1 Tax=Rhabditophanes sp. KR3021 TaxID=114890 RepID=A0AC35UDF8_9BILA